MKLKNLLSGSGVVVFVRAVVVDRAMLHRGFFDGSGVSSAG